MTRRGAGATVLVTCEHGGYRIPAEHAALFRGRERLLRSHRGQDAGALDLACHLARSLDAPRITSRLSRLLVDLNRSERNPAVFSTVTRSLPREARARLIARYHRPHRERVERAVRRAVERGGTLLHLAVHSFAPVVRGERRQADASFLYDPSRRSERRVVARLVAAVEAEFPRWRVRRNYPYLGVADGLTTHLRRRFGDASYAGIEIEINQRHPRRRGASWDACRARFVSAIVAALENPSESRGAHDA